MIIQITRFINAKEKIMSNYVADLIEEDCVDGCDICTWNMEESND
jgi:hypothetical protein